MPLFIMYLVFKDIRKLNDVKGKKKVFVKS